MLLVLVPNKVMDSKADYQFFLQKLRGPKVCGCQAKNQERDGCWRRLGIRQQVTQALEPVPISTTCMS